MDGQKLLGEFLGSGGAAMLVACLLGTQVELAGAQTSQGTNVLFAYVGSFTTAQRKARGDGIHVYRVAPFQLAVSEGFFGVSCLMERRAGEEQMAFI